MAWSGLCLVRNIFSIIGVFHAVGKPLFLLIRIFELLPRNYKVEDQNSSRRQVNCERENHKRWYCCCSRFYVRFYADSDVTFRFSWRRRFRFLSSVTVSLRVPLRLGVLSLYSSFLTVPIFCPTGTPNAGIKCGERNTHQKLIRVCQKVPKKLL